MRAHHSSRIIVMPVCKPLALAVALALAAPGAPWAAPTFPEVVRGAAVVTAPITGTTLVTQSTDKAIIEWRDFSINIGETVRFQQPGASSVALNRVSGTDPSSILGRLQANGKVFLVNRNGILFGGQSRVDVGSLVASTMDIANDDFEAERYNFTAQTGAGVSVGAGAQLTAAERGTIALLGATVTNNGTIAARMGTVGLAAGSGVTLDFAGDGLTQIQVSAGAINALVDNGGAVLADGGRVVMRADALNALAGSLINQHGLVQAQTISEVHGKLVLDAGSSGTVNHTGTLSVTGLAPGESGGGVALAGQTIVLGGQSVIDARGHAGGGIVQVDGAGDGQLPRASTIDMAAGAQVLADATGAGSGGAIYLQTFGTLGLHGVASVQAAGSAETGAHGGDIVTAGSAVDASGFQASAAAPNGQAGNWSLTTNILTVDAPLAASIGRALDTNTNVALTTYATDESGPIFGSADIVVNASIQKTTPGRAALTLNSEQDIIVAAGVQIAATPGANFSGGLLDVNFNSSAGEYLGGIVMLEGSAIRTNGGNIALYGSGNKASGSAYGSVNNPDGVLLLGATLDTFTAQPREGAGGNVRISGTSYYGDNPPRSPAARASYDGPVSGVVLTARSRIDAAGDVTIAGRADAAGQNGVDLSGDIHAGGAIHVTGVARYGAANGVVGNSALLETTAGGAIGIDGQSRNGDGVALNNTSVKTAGAGTVRITGAAGDATEGPDPDGPFPRNDGTVASPLAAREGPRAGVSMAGAYTIFGTDGVTIVGTGQNAANGVDLTGSMLAASGLSVFGHAAGDGANGVVLHEAALTSYSGSAIDILGRAEYGNGVAVTDTSIRTSGGPGGLVLAGESAIGAAGVALRGAHLGGAGMTGAITISALNNPEGVSVSAPMLSIDAGNASSVTTAGVAYIRPGGVDANGVRTDAPAVAIGVGSVPSAFQVDLAALGLGTRRLADRVVIGSSAHRGAITYGAQGTFHGDLTLQNGGLDSGGIGLASSLAASGLVTLATGGIVNGVDHAIVADGLLLHGSQEASRFILTNPGNAFNRLAASVAERASPVTAIDNRRGIDVVDSVDLTLGRMVGNTWNDALAAAGTIDAASTVAAGDALVRTAGKLTLASNVSSLDGGITLVAGSVLDNSANASLVPAAGYGWNVFADTWVGEVRGNLAPALVHPNYYNVAFCATCASPPVSVAGNHFIYRRQPTLVLTGAALARTYGDANPALAYGVSGLVNGDTAADVLSGAYATAATATSHVGTYAVDGAFASLVGYALDVRSGSLAIDPAALLVSIDNKNKVYGGADPLLTATYTGLKLGETGAVVRGLALAAPVGAAATAGTHAITGSGAAADNYAVTYQEGVLSVAPAQLTYTATPSVHYAGASGAGLSGSVTGFVYGESVAGATSGTLVFDTPASRPLAVGTYAVLGSGLTAANYRFVQAPANQAALMVLANLQVPTNPEVPVNPLALLASQALAPEITRDLTFTSSALYDRNVVAPRVCVGAATFASGSGAGDMSDLLGLEWSRVRISPNLSNCFSLGARNACSDF